MPKLIDLTGQKFGRLTVIKRVYPNLNKKGTWLCKCICKTKKIIRGNDLIRGKIKSCDCLHKGSQKVIDLTGQKFGRWTVIKRELNSKDGKARFLCRCACEQNTERIVLRSCLIRGRSKSCGCFKREKLKLTPGLASKRMVITSYKRHAKERGFKWELTDDQFSKITQKDCFYCGIEPTNIAKSKGNNGEYIYNGIDRIDNTKGYTIDNIVPCCKICNNAKHTLTLQEFKDWIEKIYNRMKGE